MLLLLAVVIGGGLALATSTPESNRAGPGAAEAVAIGGGLAAATSTPASNRAGPGAAEAAAIGGGLAAATSTPASNRAGPGAAEAAADGARPAEAAAEKTDPPRDQGREAGGENPAAPDSHALSERLFYLVLAAEMALNRDDLAAAAGIYAQALDEAEDIKDSWLPDRAGQVAFLARNWPLTLSASLAALRRDIGNSASATRGALAAVNSGNFKVASGLIWGRKPLCKSAEPLTEARCTQKKTEAMWTQLRALFVRDQLLAFCRAAPAAGKLDLAFLALCGDSALKAGDNAAAILAAEAVLAVYSENLQARMLLAEAAIDSEHEEEAFNGLRDLIKRLEVDFGQDLDALKRYADLLIRAGRNGEVRPLISHLKGRSGPPDQLLYPGLKLLQQGADGEAQRWLSYFAGQKPPVQWLADHYLGLMAEERQDYDAALERYRRVAGGKRHHESVRRIASVQAMRGDLDAALKTLAQSRAGMDEGEFEPRMRSWLTESRLLREARSPQRAAKSLGHGIQELGDQPMSQIHLFYARGLIWRELERVPAFIGDMESALAINSNFPPALNALAYYWIEEDIHLDRARVHLDRALQFDPNNSAIIDSYGWLEFKERNYERALEHLRRALKHSFHPEIAAHLIEALWVLGQKEEATSLLQRAQERFPDDPLLKLVIAKLKQ